MAVAEYRSVRPSRDPMFTKIPGSNGFPLIGQLFSLIYNLPQFIESCHNKYGPVFRVNAGVEKLVIVLGADLAEKVLVLESKNYSAELGYRRLLPLFGRGILQHDFDEHLFQRRMFQTAFRSNALRGYVRTIATIMHSEIRQWAEITSFRLYPHVKALLLRTALAVFFGIHQLGEPDRELADAFIDAMNGTIRIFDINFPGFKMRKALRGRKVLREYLGGLVSERRVNEGTDVLSHICKERNHNGEYFSDDELIDHAAFLLLAAHDTTATLLQHLVYCLTKYPEWLGHIRNEVGDKSILEMEYDDIQTLQRTGWVIDEVLRTHSSTPAMMRATLRTVTLNGVSIPPNSTILLIPGFNHHAQEHWLNPHRFDPARFSAGRCEHQRHSFSYIPFGAGVHKCIGMHFARMQAALFITYFVTLYNFDLPKGYKPRFEYLPLTKICGGLPLNLRSR